MVALTAGLSVRIRRYPNADAKHRGFVMVEDFPTALLALVERIPAHLLHVPFAALILRFVRRLAPPAHTAIAVLFRLDREFQRDPRFRDDRFLFIGERLPGAKVAELREILKHAGHPTHE